MMICRANQRSKCIQFHCVVPDIDKKGHTAESTPTYLKEDLGLAKFFWDSDSSNRPDFHSKFQLDDGYTATLGSKPM